MRLCAGTDFSGCNHQARPDAQRRAWTKRCAPQYTANTLGQLACSRVPDSVFCSSTGTRSASVAVYRHSRHITLWHRHAGTGKSSLVCALCLGLGGNTKVCSLATSALQRVCQCTELVRPGGTVIH